MKGKQNLKFVFHNPNTPEETEDFIAKWIANISMPLLEQRIKEYEGNFLTQNIKYKDLKVADAEERADVIRFIGKEKDSLSTGENEISNGLKRLSQ